MRKEVRGTSRKTKIERLEETLQGLNYLLNYCTRSFLLQEGLTLPRFWALVNLARREPTTMGELQERLLITYEKPQPWFWMI